MSVLKEIKAFIFKNNGREFIASPNQVETKKLDTYIKCDRCDNFTDDIHDLFGYGSGLRVCGWCLVSFEEWLGRSLDGSKNK